jgi:drug/metabolite transporter (DMT)-like permease
MAHVVPAQRESSRSWMLLPLLGFLWGSSYLWIDILGGTFAPTMVILLRTLAALTIIGSMVLIGRRKLPPFGKGWGHLLVVTVAADLLPFFMLIWAQQTVASSVAAVLNSTIPLFTLLIAALVFRSEKITRERFGGIVLAIVGVVALSGTGQSAGSFVSPGVVAVTASSVFYGFGFVYARRYVRGDAFGIVALQMLMTIPLLLPVTFFSGSLTFNGMTPGLFVAALGLGTMSSGLAYAIYYQALDKLGPTMTSYATYLSPIFALVIGWAVLGERIGLIGYLGIFVIALGVLTAAGLSRGAIRYIANLAGERGLADVPPAIIDEPIAEAP